MAGYVFLFILAAELLTDKHENASWMIYLMFANAVVDIGLSKDDPYALSDWAAILILLGLVFVVDSFEPGHWVVIPFVIIEMAVLAWLIWYRKREFPKE